MGKVCSCGFTNSETSKFCSECGAPLKKLSDWVKVEYRSTGMSQLDCYNFELEKTADGKYRIRKITSMFAMMGGQDNWVELPDEISEAISGIAIGTQKSTGRPSTPGNMAGTMMGASSPMAMMSAGASMGMMGAQMGMMGAQGSMNSSPMGMTGGSPMSMSGSSPMGMSGGSPMGMTDAGSKSCTVTYADGVVDQKVVDQDMLTKLLSLIRAYI